MKGFGSYGDIMIRDRKMYVVPTPFHLAEGLAHYQTLILPADTEPGNGFVTVGELRRKEADELIVDYTFDLKTNEIIPKKIPNPGAGREHNFRAWKVKGAPSAAVTLRSVEAVIAETESTNEEYDE